MIHEFRTPVNSIVMLSRLLMDDQKTGSMTRQSDISSKIYHAGNSLLEIINSYLDYSKAFAGIKADPSYIDLDSVRKSMEGMFFAKSKLKGLTFRWDMEDHRGGKVFTDRFLVEQILKNLLSNAFKYTNTGGVEVTVSFKSDSMGRDGGAVDSNNGSSDAQPGVLTITVSDTGAGISKEKQQAIFEEYQQVDEEIQSVFGGTGLGLSIAQKAAEILDGVITLESEPGTGSTFTFTHPVKLLPSDDVSAGETEPDESDLVKMGTERSELNSDETVLAQDGLGQDVTRSAKKYLTQVEMKFSEPGSIDSVLEESLPQLSVISRADDLEQAEAEWGVRDPGLRNAIDYTTRAEAVHKVQERGAPYSHELEPDHLNLEPAAPTKEGEDQSSDAILLIDDSSLHSMALKEYLESSVESVLQAKSAEEAYRTLDMCEIDTVILDMTLPDASGEDVLKRIRETPKWCKMKVVIYTGLPLSDRRLKQPRKIGIPIVTKSVNSYRKLKSVILGQRPLDSAIYAERDP